MATVQLGKDLAYFLTAPKLTSEQLGQCSLLLQILLWCGLWLWRVAASQQCSRTQNGLFHVRQCANRYLQKHPSSVPFYTRLQGDVLSVLTTVKDRTTMLFMWALDFIRLQGDGSSMLPTAPDSWGGSLIGVFCYMRQFKEKGWGGSPLFWFIQYEPTLDEANWISRAAKALTYTVGFIPGSWMVYYTVQYCWSHHCSRLCNMVHLCSRLMAGQTSTADNIVNPTQHQTGPLSPRTTWYSQNSDISDIFSMGSNLH